MEQVTLTLRSGSLVAQIRPEYGGRITRFYRDGAGGQDFLRPTPPQAGDVNAAFKTGCFPLVPFSNRIRRGRFTFQGREVTLPPQPQAAPHAIHGHGNRVVWTVTRQGEDVLTLEYRHRPDDWPWAYRAEQAIRLTGEGLTVTLSVTNTGREEMPVGLGLHPFFDHEPGTRLAFRANGHWLADESFLPYGWQELPRELDFAAGRELTPQAHDHSFTGWDGRARIHWPGRPEGLEIQADSLLDQLILHRPAQLPYFCLEPVSHVTDAFNLDPAGWQNTGLEVLASHDTLAATCRFLPQPSPQE